MDNSQYFLDQFKKYISLQTASSNTIKNYLSDLRVFFNFCSNQLNQPLNNQTLSTLLSENTLLMYDDYLSKSNPATTAKRRTSSLKKFIEFCSTLSITPPPPPPPPTPSTPNIPESLPITEIPASPNIPGPTPWSIPNLITQQNQEVFTTPTPPPSPTPTPTPAPTPTPTPTPTPNDDNIPSLVNFLAEPEVIQKEEKTHKVSSNKINIQLAIGVISIFFLLSFAATYFIITLWR